MEKSEKIIYVKTMVTPLPEYSDELAAAYLSIAGERMLNRLYPFGKDGAELPERYHLMQCELAARMILRRGSEGETAHNENGINRTYGSVNDEDIMSRLTPYAEVL